MSATSTVREDRIELRATKEEKRLLATAAAYERLDVTSFIMRNVLPTARQVVDRAERIMLTAARYQASSGAAREAAQADPRPLGRRAAPRRS